MKERFASTIKKEEKPFTIFQSYPKQDQKKDPDELNTKSVCFSYPSFIPTINSSKLRPKLFIGDKSFSKALKEDQKIIDKVKRHLDQEYLEKYRNKYVFVQSPPRHEIPEKSPINMEINLSSSNRETIENSNKAINNNENQRKEIKKGKIKKEKEDDVRSKKSTKINSNNDDDLPIALRRTQRPSTKPLRYWLGEKIVYKIDNETGCYTKAFELTVDDNDDSTQKQEFIVKKNSTKEFTAKNKGKKFTVENGEIHLLINGKIFKTSAGCVFYIPKGQKMTFDNKSDDDIQISFI